MPIFLYKLPDWSALEICYHNSMLAVQIYLQLLGFSLILSLLKVIYTVLCFVTTSLCRYQFDRLPSPPPPPPPPSTDCRATNFFPSKFLSRGQLYGAKLQSPGRKNEAKSPPPGIISLLKCKISIQNEHNSIKAVFRERFLSKFSIIVRLTVFFYRENKLFAFPYKHLRLTVWKQFENHSHCGRSRYSSVNMQTCAIHIFLGFSAN